MTSIDVLRKVFSDELGWDEREAEAEHVALADLEALVQAAEELPWCEWGCGCDVTAALARVKGDEA